MSNTGMQNAENLLHREIVVLKINNKAKSARITELLTANIKRAELDITQDALIISLQDQLRESHAAETAAKHELNEVVQRNILHN